MPLRSSGKMPEQTKKIWKTRAVTRTEMWNSLLTEGWEGRKAENEKLAMAMAPLEQIKTAAL